MIPTSFDESNDCLGSGDIANTEALSIYRGVVNGDQPVVISCWKMTAEELEEVKRTRRVWLLTLGETMAPATLNGIKPFETLLAAKP